MRFAFLTLALFASVAASRLHAASFKVIAVTGVTAPDVNRPELTVERISSASVSDNGRVAFSGEVSGPGVDSFSNDALFSYSQAGLKLESRQTDLVNGLSNGETHAGYYRPAINDSGKITFRGILQMSTGGISEYVATSSQSGLQLLARQGEQAFGAAGGETYTLLNTEPEINNAGDVVFFGFTSQGHGIWAKRNGIVEKITLTGDPSPGSGAFLGVVEFGTSGLQRRYELNENGAVAFLGWFEDEGWLLGRGGLFVDSGSGPSEVVLDESSAFNTETGFSNITSAITPTVQLNDSGQVAFTSHFSDESNPAYAGVWRSNGGTTELVVRSGDAAPGVLGGEFGLGVSHTQERINNSGNIAFLNYVKSNATRPNGGTGIWTDRNGILEFVAMTGTAAPGFSSEWVFSGLGGYPIGYNDNGTVVFTSYVSHPGFPPEDARLDGIWISQEGQATKLLVGQGSVIDVDPDPVITTLKTVHAFESIDAQRNVFDLTETDELLVNIVFEEGGEGLFLFDFAQSPVLSGDYDLDSDVDGADFLTWQKSYGSTNDLAADGDRDGAIDNDDLAVWHATYGQAFGSAQASSLTSTVPEPTGISLLVLATSLSLCSRRAFAFDTRT